MRRPVFQLGFWLVLAFAPPAQALSYIPLPDEALLQQAEVVLAGEILSVHESAAALAYPVHVVEVYKGSVPGNQLTLQVPGNSSYRVPGVARFAPGERAILFLNGHADGSYGLTHLNLGAFHELIEGESLLKRELEGLSRLGASTPLQIAINELPRSAQAMRDWLIEQHPESGLAPGPLPLRTSAVTAKFTLLGSGGRAARWRVFDQGGNVAFFAHSTPQQGLPGGGIAQLQQAIAAWTDDAGSNIRYVYGGLTSASGPSDGISSVLFNDPGGLVDGIFDCLQGGVLAVGGYVTNGALGSYRGTNYELITEGDIVVNNNAGCFLSGNNGSNAAELFAHELGHTLGFGHACGEGSLPLLSDCLTAGPLANDALMRAYVHGDGRGASLRQDDRAAAAFLYGEGGAAPAGVTGGAVRPVDNGSSGGGCVMRAGRSDASLLAVLLGAAFFAQRRRLKECR